MTEKQRTLGDSQEAVRRTIEVNSAFDVAFLAMNALATVVACCGLFENSPAVVIGAMIIAMLLGPISGVGLGLVDKNNNLPTSRPYSGRGHSCRLRGCLHHRSDPIPISID